jgi:hypothetical protein
MRAIPVGQKSARLRAKSPACWVKTRVLPMLPFLRKSVDIQGIENNAFQSRFGWCHLATRLPLHLGAISPFFEGDQQPRGEAW